MLSLPEDTILAFYKAKDGGGYSGGCLERLPVTSARALGLEIWSAAERWLGERVRPGMLYVSPRDGEGNKLEGFTARLIEVRTVPAIEARPQREIPMTSSDADRQAAAREASANAEWQANRTAMERMELQARIDAEREERAEARERAREERAHTAAVELKRLELAAEETRAARQAAADQQRLLLDLALRPREQPAAPAFDPMTFVRPMIEAQIAGMQSMNEMAMKSNLAIMENAAKSQSVPAWADVLMGLGQPIVQGIAWKLGQQAPAANPGSATSPATTPATASPGEATAPRTNPEPTGAATAEQRRDAFAARQRHVIIRTTMEHLQAIHDGTLPDDETAMDRFLELCPADVQNAILAKNGAAIVGAVQPVALAEPPLAAWVDQPGVGPWLMSYMDRARTVLEAEAGTAA